MNEDSALNIIKDLTKIFNEIKKKKNEDLNSSLNNCLNNLNLLKEKISENNKENIEENLLSISISFIESSKQIIILKLTKFFMSILILIKKLIEFSIFSREKSGDLVELLCDIYNNSKINDECQNKVLEILQTLIFTSFFEVKYDILSNIYILILKSFNNTNNSKNKDFKNPIRLLFTTITEKVYKSNNFEIIIQITILIFSWYNLSRQKKVEYLSRKSTEKNDKKLNLEDNIINNEFIDDIDDKLKEEIYKIILNHKKNNIYIQCLSLELLSQGFYIINNERENEKQDQFDINFLNRFIKDKLLRSFILSIENIKNNNSANDDSLYYLLYIKTLKLIKIILFNYEVNYDIIESIIDLINENQNQNKISWKTKLSFEFLFKIISNYELLEKIGKWKKELLESIFKCIYNFIDNIESLKDDKDNKKLDTIISDFMKKKEIDNNKIYIEGDEIIILKEKSKKFYKKEINEYLINLIDCLLKENSKNNILDKDMFGIICNNIKDILFKLLKNEMINNINIPNYEESDIIIYVNHIKNMIELFNNMNVQDQIEEYFKNLSELALSFPKDKNINDDNNIFIALNLLYLIKTPKLINKNVFVKVLQTIEIFNHKYNYLKLNEYYKNDLDKIIQDIKKVHEGSNKYVGEGAIDEKIEIAILKEEKKEINGNNENKDENGEKQNNEKENISEKKKKEEDKGDNQKEKLRNNLCLIIDKMFFDSKFLELDSLKAVVEALLLCIETSINKNFSKKKRDNIEIDRDNKGNEGNKYKDRKSISKTNSISIEDEDTFNYEILFYYDKILTITILNTDKIYILFDPFISVINKLVDNKIMANLSIEILCSLIPEIILKYDNIKENINKNISEENKIWIDERWQKLLFSPLLTLLSQIELYEYIKEKIFTGLNKIIQQSGHFIDLFGWESIIQSCIILSNYDIENSFSPFKRILNDYIIYLTLFNIIPIMKLLKQFISNKNDKNISFSSVELFWSCANLIDDYKQGRRHVENKEKPLYDKLLKGKELKIYCDDLYNQLFSYLIIINEDKRIDVRKSGLNVFTEIFVSKINTIGSNVRLGIIKNVFFKIFSFNADEFISDNKNKELEQALQISLLDFLKILKDFNNEDEKNKIFEDYLSKLMEIIPFGSLNLNSDILKSILDIKINKNENTSMIIKRLDIYFKILLLINDFINGPNFVVSQFNKVNVYRLFNGIISFIENIFLDKNNSEIYTDENLEIIFNIENTIFKSVYLIEPKLIEIKPRKLVDFEQAIFGLFEKMEVQKIVIFSYLINKINFDIKNLHDDAISRRSLECLKNILNKNENKFGLKKEEYEMIKVLMKKIQDIILLSIQNDAIESLIKASSDENKSKESLTFHIYLSHFIQIVDEISSNFIKYKENLDNEEIIEEKNEIINNIYEFFILIVDIFENIFNQLIKGFKSKNQLYYQMINEAYNQMEIDLIHFVINKLLFYILFILGDEDENIFKKIEAKIMKLIILICDSLNNSNNNDIFPTSLNQFCINELLKLCQYKSTEEIISQINNKKIINLDKYIDKQIKVSKMLANLVIQKIIEILKKFREDEIRSGGMPLSRIRIKEIVDLLNNIKEMEIFPDINLIEDYEIKKEKQEDKTIFDILSKTKKIHLFYLQPILNDFIDIKEEDIRKVVKEIFQKISDILQIPKLKNLNI